MQVALSRSGGHRNGNYMYLTKKFGALVSCTTELLVVKVSGHHEYPLIQPSAWDCVLDLEETTASTEIGYDGIVKDNTATIEEGCVFAYAFSDEGDTETRNFFELMRSELAVADPDDHPLELYMTPVQCIE